MQFDFGIKKYRIFIEVQGDYWHANPKIYNYKNLTKQQCKNVERDKIKKCFAEKNNFKLFYIWEQDILDNDFTVLDEIKNYVKKIQTNSN